MARYPGCTNSGSCKPSIDIAIAGIHRHVTVDLIGTGATVDDSGLVPFRDDYDINAQPPGQIQLKWADAVFVQRHRVLGPVWLRLAPARQSSWRSISFVESLSSEHWP